MKLFLWGNDVPHVADPLALGIAGGLIADEIIQGLALVRDHRPAIGRLGGAKVAGVQAGAGSNGP